MGSALVGLGVGSGIQQTAQNKPKGMNATIMRWVWQKSTKFLSTLKHVDNLADLKLIGSK